MAESKKLPSYQNNPFVVATDGLNQLFKKAMPIAIVGLVLSVLGLVGNIPSDLSRSYENGERIDPGKAIADNLPALSPEAWMTIGIVGLILLIGFVVIGTFISGIFDYTSAQLAKDKEVTLGEAFKAVAARFFSYLWLQILIGVKVLLWSLLLVVPGIIMAIRYSLAGPSFFRHTLGANAATKHSAAITKGAWLTTFGSLGLFNLITFGLIQPLLQPGTSAQLLRQYDAYNDAKLEKPSAHPLSWLVLGLMIAIIVVAAAAGVALFLLFSRGFSEGQMPTF